MPIAGSPIPATVPWQRVQIDIPAGEDNSHPFSIDVNYVLGNGQMYLWGGTNVRAKDTLLATLATTAGDASASIALRLLGAQAGQLASLLQITGNVLSVNPGASFVGDIWILASASDDTAYTTAPGNNRFAYQMFKTTVTN